MSSGATESLNPSTNVSPTIEELLLIICGVMVLSFISGSDNKQSSSLKTLYESIFDSI